MNEERIKALEEQCSLLICRSRDLMKDIRALKVPPPSPRPKAGQKARESLESRLMPILKKWWDGYQRQDKAATLKEYCDLRWPERGDMSLSLFLMNKVNAHRMTIPQMRTILNILEAD